jgi:hypothetical protein
VHGSRLATFVVVSGRRSSAADDPAKAKANSQLAASCSVSRRETPTPAYKKVERLHVLMKMAATSGAPAPRAVLYGELGMPAGGTGKLQWSGGVLEYGLVQLKEERVTILK